MDPDADRLATSIVPFVEVGEQLQLSGPKGLAKIVVDHMRRSVSHEVAVGPEVDPPALALGQDVLDGDPRR